NGWFASDVDLLTDQGTQIAPLNYSHLGHTEIFDSVEEFYKKFYFRPSKIAEILGEMLTSREMMKRRLREGVEFFHFLRERGAAH
ncbi:MAG: hopanoid biosynthesis associated radical SAM protein HpnJ, partial [Xanthobacteraceae bacterium]